MLPVPIAEADTGVKQAKSSCAIHRPHQGTGFLSKILPISIAFDYRGEGCIGINDMSAGGFAGRENDRKWRHLHFTFEMSYLWAKGGYLSSEIYPSLIWISLSSFSR